MNIDASLLREKFIINEENAESYSKALRIVCPSTRMLIRLQSAGLSTETYIVRTYNMHSCARMVAQIISNYESNGPIIPRSDRIDWNDLWDKSIPAFERKYNAKGWVAIYHNGNTIYSNGEYHKFFDVIEKCDVINKGSYEESIKLAENSFEQAGTKINMHYDSNIALVAILSKNGGRCSMILRWPGKTTTFNYTFKPLDKQVKFNVSQGLSTASDFFEGVQLAYSLGVNNEMLKQELIDKSSDKNKQAQDTRKRIEDLDIQINSMERRYDVRYRPERPDFDRLVEMAEKFTAESILNDDGNDGI